MRALLFLFCLPAFAADPLPALRADGSGVTVSGLSSGGYMAVQLHVAHSSVVKGAGVIAAGPYYCAQGSLWTAYYNCTDPGLFVPLPATALLKMETESLAKAGRVDATSNLAASRAWLFTGSQDRRVSRDVVEALLAFYSVYKVGTVIVRDKAAGHAMITEDAGNACGASEAPYINDCGYDAAGEMLEQLLGPLAPRAAKESGRLLRFDQKPFGSYSVSMDDNGFVYVPQACEAGGCRIHVAFHGCRQNASSIGERYVRDAGYNRWADTNRLIVLYPQTIARYLFVFNPRACWDWWGYTGAQYHTKEGAQIRAVKAMLDRLSSR